MSTASVTVTGTTGPDIDSTAKVFTNVKEIKFQIDRNVITIRHGAPEIITDFDYAITATVTYTISGGHATVTIA